MIDPDVSDGLRFRTKYRLVASVVFPLVWTSYPLDGIGVNVV
jgi:hypothetical protein